MNGDQNEHGGYIAASKLTDEQKANVQTNIDRIDGWLDAAVLEMASHLIEHTHDPDDPTGKVCAGRRLSQRLAVLDEDSSKMALQLLIRRTATFTAATPKAE